MYSDKVDIEQHIEFNKDGMQKLQTMTDGHRSIIDGQQNTKRKQTRAIAQHDEQIQLLSNEKNLTLLEIKKYKEELARLRLLLKQKKAEIDALDSTIADYEARIDALYD